MTGIDKRLLAELGTIADFYRSAIHFRSHWDERKDEWGSDPYLFSLAMSAYNQLNLGPGPILRELGRWEGIARSPDGPEVTSDEVLHMFDYLVEKHHEQVEAEKDRAWKEAQE